MAKQIPIRSANGQHYAGSVSIPTDDDIPYTPKDVPVDLLPSVAPPAGSEDYAGLYGGFTELAALSVEEEERPIALYEVGGCVRDGLLGVESKDVDFTVEASSFDAMRDFLEKAGFEIFLESPEYLTIRARFPKNITHPAIPTRFQGAKQLPTSDFVLARREGVYTDGRRPDEVFAGTILDDLARRDFTVNAIARDKDGNFLDPHNGRGDLALGILRAVGNPEDRIREDALRSLRALRFSITKNLTMTEDLGEVIHSEWLPPLLASISMSRRQEEMKKMFKADTLRTLDVLADMPSSFRAAVFADGLWLEPTNKQ